MIASRYPYKRLVGVEFSSELDGIARKNVELFRAGGQKGNFELVCMDAGKFEPPEDDVVFYLFNPFAAPVMEQVVANVVRSLTQRPRRVAFLYVFPAHKELIERTGLFKARTVDTRFTLFTNW